MNREILFRAKCFGNWRYGNYVHFDKKPTNSRCNINYKDFIITNEDDGEHYYPISELSSLGQYTGLKDSTGKEIYEGDILKTPRGFIGEVVFGRAEEECTHRLFRRMITDVFTTYGWVFKRADGFTIAIDDEILQGELIGNVTDNPELMK
ncbi:MAG: hypothetical protein HXN33_07115 [Prevotella histicola]|uniref:YopX protein domain-containing protein n=1 Tax=Prevotella histicola TaxID=470565 RepID=A0A930N600_9BACT|nr:hypothetical protein [Prevotella histicola]